MTRTVKLKFIEDPGHGWLEVPLLYLVELGIQHQITRYSYVDFAGKNAYLEEDLDYGTFTEAAKAAGWTITLNEVYTDDWIGRNWPDYPTWKTEAA